VEVAADVTVAEARAPLASAFAGSRLRAVVAAAFASLFCPPRR
jgi:hypothetical protein